MRKMQRDKVIDSLTIGQHNGDDIISAWTHATWQRRHAKAVRIEPGDIAHHHFSQDPWERFLGFENTYQLKMRQAPTFRPISDPDRVTLPGRSVGELLGLYDEGHRDDTLPTTFAEQLSLVHRKFHERDSLDLGRALLDELGWSCVRTRYNYESKKIHESMVLSQYIDGALPPDRYNHRYLILVVGPRTRQDLFAAVAGKALISALFKDMSGVTRGKECEVFCLGLRGTKAQLWRVVFEPEFLADVARGLEPIKPAYLFNDAQEHELMQHAGRLTIVDKLERLRRAMHARI
ncbi:hypothetical protein PYCC9005_002312 [Savitreella phatthalungensis]